MLNELITFFTAALPLSELRGAIPLAILKFGFSPYKAFVISALGNILPVLPLLLGLEKISEYLSHKFYWFNRFFNWLFERVRIKNSGHFTYWGNLALFIFVAIPLPLTGAYSGAVAAFVFGIPLKHAFWSIVFGVLAAGFVVTTITIFGENIFKYLFLL
ncbi:MAG: small multi-drug export protein [Candidatus Azambacteria bacterium]|nr:small multi-drug export protein [Candidatus Azambacteria bacterium]